MFQKLGSIVCRFWPGILLFWLLLLLTLMTTAPEWREVVKDGEFAFLPEDVPSRIGEIEFGHAFPEDMRASTIVIVLARESNPDGLEEPDREFITDVLVPRIHEIAEQEGGLAWNEDDDDESVEDPADDVEPDSETTASSDENRSIIARIRAFDDKEIGGLLESDDSKATLVYVELTTEFLDYRNNETLLKIESLIEEDEEIRRQRPNGLAISISGSATVGRDMRRAATDSAKKTEFWTILLVMVLLIIIYRAPVLTLIPLTTVFFATGISLGSLAFLGQAGWVELFDGIEIYVTVLVYGAGVDYCLFLIARYKEEIDDGATYDEATVNCLGKVGHAIAASAGTVMCGIGMMVFAEFGKFQQAGIAITYSLGICLAASLTLTPALLRLTNRWAFWPKVRTERISAHAGWISATSLMDRLTEKNWFQEIWKSTGRLLLAYPGRVFVLAIVLMLPFAVIGTTFFSYLSYGLLAELPQTEASVMGAKAIQMHFPAGYVDPVKVLIRNDEVDFTKTQGVSLLEDLTNRLQENRESLGIADIRSVSHPQGGTEGLAGISLLRRRVAQRRSIDHYVSQQPGYADHTTRLEIVFEDDPFSRNGISQLETFKRELRNLLPDDLQTEQTELHFIGATPSIYDLKQVTDRDQIHIDALVLMGVFLILVILLRRPAISAYLIVSVFFSYLVTLGMTFFVFWALDPAGFAGLDWKVPMFLFTILIAVGEDYNIFLMTRIEEEQLAHGQIQGIIVALEKTGSIISSCGVIMAGTFSSLLAGSLVGMHQLGFALAFGVLLDTFVVRPILVPAYLILLHSGRFGRLGKHLGAVEDSSPIPDAAKAQS